MWRNRLVDFNADRAFLSHHAQQALGVFERPFRIGSLGGEFRTAGAMKASADLLQANADPAETPAKTAMKVQKTEMQARRRLDLDDLTH